MKKIISLFLIASQILFAQQPSKKDLQEYQKLMNDPEVKKYLKGKNVPNANTLQQQINFANQNTTRQQNAFPKKDIARIAAVPKTILTNEQLKTYLLKAKLAVQKKVSAENKNIAEQFLKQTLANADSVNYSTVAALWLGKANPQVALYILSEAVTKPDLDAGDVNNFAALLNINGGEQLALPILQKINVEYPNNSTVLNNIGQAWFGLGDFNKSEKYIDSSLHFFAGNAEANYTKCFLQLQKGNKQQAIDYLVKSIRNGYDPNKEKKLNQLGKKLSIDDLSWGLPKPPDPLGLESILLFRPEDFYTDINGQNSLSEKWKIFEKQVADAKKALSNSFKEAANGYAATFQQMMLHPPQGPIVSNFMQRKAGKMFDARNEDFKDYITRMAKEKLELFKDITTDEMQVYSQLSKIRERLEHDKEEYLKQSSEYSGDVERKFNDKFCQEAAPLVDNFLGKYNPLVESYATDYIKHIKVYVSNLAYLAQFVFEDENLYQGYISGLKDLFLDDLYGYPGRSTIPTAPVYFDLESNCSEIKKIEMMIGKLPDFDSVNCNTHISIEIPGVGSTHWDCNKETDDYDLGAFKIKYSENMNTGVYNVHAELTLSKTLGTKKRAIFSGEISAGVGSFVEWNNNGVTDLGVIAKAGVEGGIETEIEEEEYGKNTTIIGAEARIGINSGPSLEGEGILHGVEIKNE